jgi:hypothetical protein
MEILNLDQPDSSTTTSTRLINPWLTISRVIWIVLAFICISLFIAGIIAEIQAPPANCTQVDVLCNPIYLSVEDLEAVQNSIIPVEFLTLYEFIISLGFNLSFILVALLIFWLKSDDWMALWLSLTLMLLGAVAFGFANGVLIRTQPGLEGLIDGLESLGYFSLLTLLFIFPDGRFTHKWMKVPVFLSIIVFTLGGYLFSDDRLGLIFTLSMIILVILAVYSQIYRYKNVSNLQQRQQIKWVAFGLIAVIGVMFSWIFLFINFPPNNPSTIRTYAVLISLPAVSVIGSLFPISVAISILRFKLWEIDILINRTIVYTLLTAILALIYFGAVVLIQQIFRLLTGQASSLAIVISTLIIAALFNPLRHRIQDTINRRFYRQKYSVQETLIRFSSKLSSEVNLEFLSAQLVGILDETMQPESISLWLQKEDDAYE